MTDAQLLTLALAVVIPLSLLLYSNSKITEAKETLQANLGEAKETLRRETGEVKEALRVEMASVRGEVDSLRVEMLSLRKEMAAGFERIEMLLKVHELEHHK